MKYESIRPMDGVPISTNRPRRQSCLTFGGNQSVPRIHANTQFWLTNAESKARLTSRSISRYGLQAAGKIGGFMLKNSGK